MADKPTADEVLAVLESIQFAGPRFRCVECGGQPVCGHTSKCRVGNIIARAKQQDSSHE